MFKIFCLILTLSTLIKAEDLLLGDIQKRPISFYDTYKLARERGSEDVTVETSRRISGVLVKDLTGSGSAEVISGGVENYEVKLKLRGENSEFLVLVFI